MPRLQGNPPSRTPWGVPSEDVHLHVAEVPAVVLHVVDLALQGLDDDPAEVDLGQLLCTAQATWTKRGRSWVRQNRGVVGDGRRVASRVVLKFDKGGDTYTSTTTNRILGDAKLPDIESKYKRIK